MLKPLHATSLADWRATFEINATSAFIVLRNVMPRLMRRKRGSVVLFSTVAASTGLQNHESVAAAKSAVEGLVRSAAISYARYGIRVNAVAPALTRTALSKSLWENQARLAASVAMHRSRFHRRISLCHRSCFVPIRRPSRSYVRSTGCHG